MLTMIRSNYRSHGGDEEEEAEGRDGEREEGKSPPRFFLLETEIKERENHLLPEPKYVPMGCNDTRIGWSTTHMDKIYATNIL